MGVQDNPRVFGNWSITGIGGAINILERLLGEGYELSDEEQGSVAMYAKRLTVAAGDSEDYEVVSLREENSQLKSELQRHIARHGNLT